MYHAPTLSSACTCILFLGFAKPKHDIVFSFCETKRTGLERGSKGSQTVEIPKRTIKRWGARFLIFGR
jgi:hypothetical protein